MNRIIIYVNDIEDIRVFLNGELIGETSASLPTQKKDILTMIVKGAKLLDCEYQIIEETGEKDLEIHNKINKWFTFRTYIHPEDEKMIIHDFDSFVEKIAAT